VYLGTQSCKTEVSENSDQQPVKVIFDTDMGSDCDDAGALALLHAYANRGKAEIIACIYSSGKVPYGAAIVEAINIYYKRANIPVGAFQYDDLGDPVDKMTAEKLARDTTAFGNTIIHNSDAPDQTWLSRKLLIEQEDSSIVYLTVGHTRGLYDLLVSEPDELSPLSGEELVAKKVKAWIALGALNANNKEGNFVKDWNFFFNGTASYTEYLINNFPCPVYYVDAGSEVYTGKSLKDTRPGNIVRTAYRDWLWNVFRKTLDDQRPSWDLAAVYFAVEGEGEFLRNTGPGMLDFNPDVGNLWREGYKGKEHYYIDQVVGVEEEFADYLNAMLASFD
jgi:hypothetical protein